MLVGDVVTLLIEVAVGAVVVLGVVTGAEFGLVLPARSVDMEVNEIVPSLRALTSIPLAVQAVPIAVVSCGDCRVDSVGNRDCDDRVRLGRAAHGHGSLVGGVDRVGHGRDDRSYWGDGRSDLYGLHLDVAGVSGVVGGLVVHVVYAVAADRYRCRRGVDCRCSAASIQ